MTTATVAFALPRSLLMATAWVNIACHAVAMNISSLALPPGSPIVEAKDRLAYLQTVPYPWKVAWVAWMACAVMNVALIAGLASRAPERSGVRTQVAVLLVLVGATMDLACDYIHIEVASVIARNQMEPARAVRFDDAAWMVNVVLVKALYALGILIVTGALAAHPGFPKAPVKFARATAGMAVILLAAGLLGDFKTLAVLSFPQFCLIVLWMYLAARAAGEADPSVVLPDEADEPEAEAPPS